MRCFFVAGIPMDADEFEGWAVYNKVVWTTKKY
mgnify:CR=1 FL=1